jgi:hypothetical protein
MGEKMRPQYKSQLPISIAETPERKSIEGRKRKETVGIAKRTAFLF